MECARPALLAAALVVAPVAGQDVAGVAHGFDGRPSGAIVVRALDANRNHLGETATAPDGRFHLHVAAPIHFLQVQAEAVRIEETIAGGSDRTLVLSFAGVGHFTVHGQLLTPDGKHAAGIDVACRDGAGRTIATHTADAEGAFRFRANQPIAALVVDPIGWAHPVPGPFDADRQLDIDLRQERAQFFCLRGTTRDERGAPDPRVRVTAQHEREVVAATASDADGNYVLWCKRPATHLFSHDGIPRTARQGNWQNDATVDLDERDHGYLVVSGRLVDARGVGSARAAVYAASQRPAPPLRRPPDGMTNADGGFCVRVPRYETHLWFFQESQNRQAWVQFLPGQPLLAKLAP